MVTLFRLLIVFILVPQLCLAGTALTQIPSTTCSSDDLATDPLTLKPVLAIPEWRDYFAQPEIKELFNADTTDQLERLSGLKRSKVSSSHIVNLLAEGFDKIRKKEAELIRTKEVLPLVSGKTYSYEEFQRRKESEASVREKYLEPMLKDLYAIYLDAVKERYEHAKWPKDKPSKDKFIERVKKQRQALNEALKQFQPGVIEKLGEIKQVDDETDLPLAYRDGYIVKIHFKKAGDVTVVSIFPRMLYISNTANEDYFLQALARWKEYCKAQWDMVRPMTKSSFAYARQYLSSFLGKSDLTPAQYVRLAPYMRLAYEQSKKDLHRAKIIRRKMAQLSATEINGLIDLMIQVRNGDIPRCSGVISALNSKMKEMLKGQSSSASKVFTSEEKAKIDKFAKDVVFYQDIYFVFSNAAAGVLSQKREL